MFHHVHENEKSGLGTVEGACTATGFITILVCENAQTDFFSLAGGGNSHPIRGAGFVTHRAIPHRATLHRENGYCPCVTCSNATSPPFVCCKDLDQSAFAIDFVCACVHLIVWLMCLSVRAPLYMSNYTWLECFGAYWKVRGFEDVVLCWVCSCRFGYVIEYIFGCDSVCVLCAGLPEFV